MTTTQPPRAPRRPVSPGEGGYGKSRLPRSLQIGGTAVAGVLGLALVGNALAGPDKSSAPREVSPYTVTQLKQMPSTPYTFKEGQGEENAIAEVDPKILTGNPDLKVEMRELIDKRLPDGHTVPQPGDIVPVPIVPGQQLPDPSVAPSHR